MRVAADERFDAAFVFFEAAVRYGGVTLFGGSVFELFGERDHLWVAYKGSWEPKMLCRAESSWAHQKLHPHPRFLPTGKAVLFTSERTGSGELYMVSV